MTSLRKESGKIIEKKALNYTNLKNSDEGFDDQLEVLGFEIGKYNCYKSLSKVEIPFMAEKQDYMIANLKVE